MGWKVCVLFSIFVIASAFISPLQAKADTGLAGWWKLDETSGTTAADSSGNGYDGTVTGTADWVPGTIGNAFHFDGNTYITTGYTMPAQNSGTSFTWTAWVKEDSSPGSDGNVVMMGWRQGDTWIKMTPTHFEYNGDLIDYTFPTGSWQFVNIVKDGDSFYYYDDGTLVGSASSSASTDAHTFYLGTDPGFNDGHFYGALDDVRIYNVALTQDQISNLNSGSTDADDPPDATPPTAWITAPAGGATIGGSSVALAATSSDNVAVAGVTFYYDSTHAIGSEITATSSPDTYTMTWDASGLSNGSHTLIAVARDTSNNYATSTAVSVTVDNTPPVISAIATSTADAGATVTWTTDEAASTKIAYSIDSSFASSTGESDTGTRVTSHSDSFSNLLSCTQYNYKVVSADVFGNYATSSTSTFTTLCPGSAVPSAATSTDVVVNTAATSTITAGGDTLTVATPANFTATSSSVVIQIKGLPSSTVLDSISKPSGLSSAAGIVFDVTALIDNTTVLDSFDHPVTITYNYTDADVSGFDPNTLTMYHYHDGQWLPLDNCSIDTAADTITCTAPSFSVFGLFGTPLATASTASDSIEKSGGTSIQQQVANLIFLGNVAEANALKKQWYWLFPTAQASSSPECPAYTFTRSLHMGMHGADVRALQQFLNCAGFTLAASGPGSPGNETIYFVTRTLDALDRFQQAYATDILAPIGASKPTGIFAKYSMAEAHALMEQ